ncbi:odorant receptor 4-like [Manduca sexta]|uniref:odorant receptor 4-like n=1 Tax=Manduca sexta TaxID=7130 RepID=UPI00188F1846|nr:odorant receptor 4-like [Manduca sexta]
MTSLWRKYFTKEIQVLKRVYERSDYEDTYEIPRKYLKWSGIRMKHIISKPVSICWLVYYWFYFANIVFAFTSELMGTCMTASANTFTDAIAFFQMVPCIGYCGMSLVKSFKMVKHRPVFENLITEIGDMWPQRQVDEEEHKIISSALREIKNVVKGYQWGNNCLILSFLYAPFWELFKRFSGEKWEPKLQFIYWLPFDPSQPVYYECTLVLQTWQAITVIWTNMTSDIMFCLFLSHITTQFNLLSVKIEKLIYVPTDQQLIEFYPLGQYSEEYLRKNKEAVDSYTPQQWEEKNFKEITEIVLQHQALIRLSEDIENMFSLTLLVNVINSSLLICLCGFCSVVLEKWNETAYKSFLVIALSQTWFVCWYGQKLIDSSKGVAEAVYNSGWYRASMKIRRSLMIIFLRSQKGVYVTTYGFSVISLTTYSTIIKTSWSYFTLLLKFTDE